MVVSVFSVLISGVILLNPICWVPALNVFSSLPFGAVINVTFVPLAALLKKSTRIVLLLPCSLPVTFNWSAWPLFTCTRNTELDAISSFTRSFAKCPLPPNSIWESLAFSSLISEFLSECHRALFIFTELCGPIMLPCKTALYPLIKVLNNGESVFPIVALLSPRLIIAAESSAIIFELR